MVNQYSDQVLRQSARDKLADLRRKLTADVANLQPQGDDRQHRGGDFESLVSAAQLASQHESDALLRRRLERRIAEIELVERRIQRGLYGLCESCGEAIPEERLAALPDATLCIACTRKGQRPQRDRLRRLG